MPLDPTTEHSKIGILLRKSSYFYLQKLSVQRGSNGLAKVNALVYAYASEAAKFCPIIHVAQLSYCFALEHLTGELLFVKHGDEQSKLKPK